MKKRFENWKAPEIKHGELTKWHWVVYYPEKLLLGKKTDIGAFTFIQAENGVIIGDEVQIGSHCSIYSVSTIDNKAMGVVIKEGAKIGSHSTVMPGVIIGRNATIGAHSFVNSDIPDDCVAFGVPARVKKRKT